MVTKLTAHAEITQLKAFSLSKLLSASPLVTEPTNSRTQEITFVGPGEAVRSNKLDEKEISCLTTLSCVFR